MNLKPNDPRRIEQRRQSVISETVREMNRKKALQFLAVFYAGMPQRFPSMPK